jgi:DNA-binding transcriptional ArsR family regulator
MTGVTTSSTLQVLGDPSRVAILEVLRDGERPVGELVTRLSQSQPGVSRHLRVLREAGLVEARAVGQRRLYRIRPEPLAELDAWLATYRQLWTERLDLLEAHLEQRRQA